MSTNTKPGGFVHSALFYRCEQEYLDAVASFVAAGLEQGDPALVAVPTHNLASLRETLGHAVAEVTMADMTDIGRNPARAMCAMDAFAAAHGRRRVRVVGEPVWRGRSAEEYPACVFNEALANLLFAGREVMALCPYDVSQLDEGVLTDARMTHPLVWLEGSSADYAPEVALARYNQPLRRHTEAVAYMVNAHTDLSALRSFVARHALWLCLSPNGVADLQIIANELATNSVQHGGGACRVAFWRQHAHVVCEVSDSGCLDDPLAGRRAPAPGALSGRGLFVVNVMTDLVRTHATATGTTIQAFLRCDPLQMLA